MVERRDHGLGLRGAELAQSGLPADTERHRTKARPANWATREAIPALRVYRGDICLRYPCGHPAPDSSDADRCGLGGGPACRRTTRRSTPNLNGRCTSLGCTSGVVPVRAIAQKKSQDKNPGFESPGRVDWIRTSDPLTPSQVRYQTAPPPVMLPLSLAAEEKIPSAPSQCKDFFGAIVISRLQRGITTCEAARFSRRGQGGGRRPQA